ncbi:MAG: MoxR family ATPase [Proteobacteria bacterium]|nr:MoxR family ATPase [Pseudomonadota bacterium]
MSGGALQRLRGLLDRHVVGHDSAKQALLLALLSREHVYLEGPPGTAKTRMAELVAGGSGLSFFFYQLHRDTRMAELVGDVVLERRPLDEGDGERIAQRIEPGGVLSCEVCVLDDISRAPGEALNVLLRVLNERRFGERELPLMTAIATGNPVSDEYYNEPLDPAHLDRFALQLRVDSLLQADPPEAARALLERFASGEVREQPEVEPVLSRAELASLQQAVGEVEVPGRVKDSLLEILRSLVADYGCDDPAALLTDRSFLVKAVKLLRGRALLAGRRTVEPEDLAVLHWMTRFRVPEAAHEALPELIGKTLGKRR